LVLGRTPPGLPRKALSRVSRLEGAEGVPSGPKSWKERPPEGETPELRCREEHKGGRDWRRRGIQGNKDAVPVQTGEERHEGARGRDNQEGRIPTEEEEEESGEGITQRGRRPDSSSRQAAPPQPRLGPQGPSARGGDARPDPRRSWVARTRAVAVRPVADPCSRGRGGARSGSRSFPAPIAPTSRIGPTPGPIRCEAGPVQGDRPKARRGVSSKGASPLCYEAKVSMGAMMRSRNLAGSLGLTRTRTHAG
jgi:hypothetical protein